MDILESLRKNICEVTFTKVNGEERVMVCTLLPDFLPLPEAITVNRVNPIEKDYVTVWDVDKSEWRAFKPSRLTNIKFITE